MFDSSKGFYQNDIVNSQVFKAAFTTQGDARVFRDINDFGSFWNWFEGPLLQSMYPIQDPVLDSFSNSSLAASLQPNLYNKYFRMIGSMQIRQVRVRNYTNLFDGVEFTVWPGYDSQQGQETRSMFVRVL